MQRTPLYQEHQKLQARFTSFAGFEMPLFYSGVKEEYWAVRKKTGLFDISHMAPVLIKAEHTREIVNYLNYITCRDLSKLKPSQVQYNALINQNGGVVDDVTIYALDPLFFMLIANASNRMPVLKHLKYYQNQLSSRCQIEPLKNHSLVALQGPSSQGVIQNLKSITAATKNLYYYECALLDSKNAPMPAVISRTGYTGEDGFEILLDQDQGISLWEEIIDLGVPPCGLASRDLLRMEVFYPLHGQELSAEKTPVESGIGWLVDDQKNFLGKQEILSRKRNPQKKTMGFKLLEEGIPRAGCEIFELVNPSAQGEPGWENYKKVGTVTSGSYSFQWERGFGMACLDASRSQEGQKLFLKIRNQMKKIVLFTKSPYKGSILRRPRRPANSKRVRGKEKAT